jgi:ATP phosphoribosyltransferase
MRACGLHAIDTVVESTAVLIKSRQPTSPANANLVKLITARIRGVITAQKYVLCTYNVKREALEAATKITPGKRSPTINGLEEAGWVAVSVMVERKKMATVMDDLTALGAEDVLITKIENSRTN